jgi:beta-galactosidase
VRLEEVDGLRVRTVEVEDGDAVVEVDVLVVNDGSDVAPRRVVTTLLGPDGSVVAEESSRLTCVPGRTEHVRRRFHLPAAALWSPAAPALHRCTVTLLEDDAERDRASTTFGVRTVRVDADRGLRINGETVKLRGACVHHDNGVLGSATIDRAEERRVELLRQAGFNAIRSAHNPMSEAMLGACDRLGMLVMDEAFDTWTEPKSTYDYARAFHDWWAADLAAMVAKDRNHPCVVLYSIGNEISDIGRPDGARRVRELADHLRTLDPDRFVTLGVNPILACGAEVFAQADAPPMPAGINSIMTLMQDYVPQVLRSQLVDERLDEAMAGLDVVGYNYVETRYEQDGELHPHRVVVGSETMPPLIGRYWPLVRDLPHVIGDFTWTGWDYLGEAGVGRIDRAGSAVEAASFMHGGFPSLVAGSGDLDITGHRRPVSYLREIAYGLRTDPYLAVVPPADHDRAIVHHSAWALTDAVASWSWPGQEGRPVTVEVFSPGDEVELLVNGVAVGRAPAGEAVELRARFETTYAAGTLEAVSYLEGREIGRASLRSGGPEVRLQVEADRSRLRADPRDLAFVTVELTDDSGVLRTDADRLVSVAVHGPAVLAGLGSARGATEESFVDAEHTTYLGRALAVVRPTGPGEITVTVTAVDCEPVVVTLSAVAR